MIRSTLQDIYSAIYNLSATYNRSSYTFIYQTIYGCVRKLNTQQNLSSTLYDKLEP